jgi:Protein of unknown function (DUF3300)
VKRAQSYMSLLMVVLLLSGTTSMQGCGAKETTSAPVVQEQSTNTASQDTSSGQQTSAAPSGQTSPQGQEQTQVQLPEVNLSADGLDELLAPVALYPDPVLAVLLQASVIPQEVMDGGNWLALDENQNLKEAALDVASKKAGFTPVMQALLHYPTVVDMMCQQFDWTKQLGAAYQGSPKTVLESVQRLRAQAVDTGALKSSPQMKVDVKQDQGTQVVELKPTDPKVVYVPQYNPEQVFRTTTTTTTSGGTTTTTTTTSGAPPSSTNSTVVVQQQSSGVSSGTAVMIGLLSFGAGIAVGSAISSNHYYYPAWGHGGVWYGPRPYYPRPYHPIYYGGWGGGYHYHRPPYYGRTTVNVNINNNYYNRFNNNNNLNPNYKPRPVPYNNNPNGAYAKNMGNTPGGNKGVNYRPANTNNSANKGTGQGNYQGNRPVNNANANARPSAGNVQTRPAGNNPNTAQRPAGGNSGNTPNNTQRPSTGNNANNWKGQTTYQGNKAPNAANSTGGSSTKPSNPNPAANSRVSPGNPPARNPSGDRGFAQPGGTRPTTGSSQIARPASGNAPASRPAPTSQPAARPAPQQANRPQPSSSGAFGGASNAKSDRAASNRAQASTGATSRGSSAGGRKK